MKEPGPGHGDETARRAEAADVQLQCPQCLVTLQQEDYRSLTCANCRRRYRLIDGVIDLRSAAQATGSEVRPPTLTAATPAGWIESVRAFLAGRERALPLLDALVGGRHQIWRGFLELPEGSNVLCLGSDFGNLIESFLSNGVRIFGLDPDLDRLRFVRQRLAIFELDGAFTPLAGSLDGRLPFADASLDALVVADPVTFQVTPRLLDEARRVLRSEGQLLLIADNRFALALPAGWWDQWASAPWPIPDVARAGGLLEAWWRKHSGAQSLPTLRRQLAYRKFRVVDVLGLWPARRQFDEILPLQEGAPPVLPEEAISRRKRVKRSALFVPAHVVIAQAGRHHRPSSYDQIYAAVARDLGGDAKGAQIRPLRYFMTRKDKMIVRAQLGQEHLVIRFPFGAAATAAEARHADAISRLSQTHPGLTPRPLASGRISGFVYRAESALPGTPVKRLMARGNRNELLERVGQLLETMNPTGSLVRERLEGPVYLALIEARLSRLFQFVRDPHQQHKLRSFFRGKLHGASMPIGLVHGDFSASNIYLNDDSQGIVDWEAAAFDDLPILDAIGYLESILRPLSPRHSLAEGFRSMARWDLPNESDRRFLTTCYDRLEIDAAHHVALVYLRWLRQIDYLSSYWLNYDPDGQERYIHQVVRDLLAAEAVSQV